MNQELTYSTNQPYDFFWSMTTEKARGSLRKDYFWDWLSWYTHHRILTAEPGPLYAVPMEARSRRQPLWNRSYSSLLVVEWMDVEK